MLYLQKMVACFIALALVASQPASAAPATLPAVTIVETKLYQIPEGSKVIDTLVSPDNLHLGVVESKNKKFNVVIDNVRSPELEWVVRGSLLFSAEGGRFAFQSQQNELMQVIAGQAGATWNATPHSGYYLVGRMLFSPDGSRLAYAAQKTKDGKMFIVVDGKEQQAFDDVFPADMQFSPDGKHLAYRAGKVIASADPSKPKTPGKQFYVVDGVPQPEFDTVGRFVFSPQGGRWGYAARNEKLTSMVIDGKPMAKFAVAAGLTFSPDGKRYAYAIEPAGPDGKPTGKQSLIHNAGDGEKQFQPFDGIGAIVFSPDCKRIAITTVADKKWSIFVDGKATGSYEGTGGMIFSPDSKRLAAVAARDKRQFIVIDGKEATPVDVVATAGFSPDSNKVVSIILQGGQRMLFLDDKRLGPATFFSFSPDSAWLAHALPAGEAKWQLAIDGQPVGEPYESAPPGSRVIWESPTAARIIAGRGTEMYLVKMSLGGK